MWNEPNTASPFYRPHVTSSRRPAGSECRRNRGGNECDRGINGGADREEVDGGMRWQETAEKTWEKMREGEAEGWREDGGGAEWVPLCIFLTKQMKSDLRAAAPLNLIPKTVLMVIHCARAWTRTRFLTLSWYEKTAVQLLTKRGRSNRPCFSLLQPIFTGYHCQGGPRSPEPQAGLSRDRNCDWAAKLCIFLPEGLKIFYWLFDIF